MVSEVVMVLLLTAGQLPSTSVIVYDNVDLCERAGRKIENTYTDTLIGVKYTCVETSEDSTKVETLPFIVPYK